jgi:hypothetical protein
MAEGARICRGRKSCAFCSFNHEWRSGHEIREVNANRRLTEIFEQSWFGEGVNANGRRSAFSDSGCYVGLKASGLVSIGEASQGNRGDYRNYGANNY